MTIRGFLRKKERGERLALLTAYDYPSALYVDAAGVDGILIGDSLGMVVQGNETTLPVTIEEILYHTRCVARATKHALVIADMPFMSYQASDEDGLRNAGRLVKEGGAQAVKVEGGRRVAGLVRRLTETGIPVMGHLGMTPQSVHAFGGFRVQGKGKAAAQQLLDDALLLEEAGAFAVILELIPSELAQAITRAIQIPTIGIGAGPGCDGEVQVFHDILGLYEGRMPRHTKRYAQVGAIIQAAVGRYVEEVREGAFPADENAFHDTGPLETRPRDREDAEKLAAHAKAPAGFSR
jgi:3-methyl-2-oxobutanoate hydroxymethyltransferase